jgi:Zn finger protein HypA/HybF involved in hydrogenase expression
MNIKCNWCDELMYLDECDTRDDCPKCHATGYLMDVVEVYTNA